MWHSHMTFFVASSEVPFLILPERQDCKHTGTVHLKGNGMETQEGN